jgi:hypothetical protein
MRIGAIFGRLLVAGAMATAVFALAAASQLPPTAVAQRHGPEHRDRGRHGSDSAEMKDVVELLRSEGFSEPYSFERERGMIEVEATGQDGRRYEIHVDPNTREILEAEKDD